ncbi:MAG: hypothetical protein O7B99_09655 [Planctomycetota bacterium]|nr:hypothetical protein [Planctomycetota bacterium]
MTAAARRYSPDAMLFRRRAESPPIPRRVGFALAAAAGVGLLGALPRADGSLDPLAMLAWVTLIAPAAGFACGAAGVRPLAGLIVPAVWMFVLVQVDLASPRDVVEPIWPALAWTGLFAGGLGLGWLRPGKPPERSWAGVGALLLGSLFFTGLGIQGGLAAGDATWGRDHPALTRLLLDVSPLAVAFDSAGWDWTHAQPTVYRLSGVEWFHRVPYRGMLAAPALLVVGCVLAAFLSRRASRKHG